MGKLVMTSCRVCILALGLVAALGAGYAAAGQGVVALPNRPDAPALSLRGVDGQRHDLADYRGQLVLVNFWAVWCGSCREEFPAMARAYRALRGAGVMMFAVNSGDSRSAVSDFRAEHPLPFPVLMDTTSEAAGQWQVQGLPTTYVITPQGEIYGGAIGARAWDEPAMLEQLRRLADELGARPAQ